MGTYPILFNDDMVKAILDGRKCVTRRLIKPQPKSPVVRAMGQWQETEACANGLRVLTPPYQQGDILYVRECWAVAPDLPGIAEAGPVYRADYMERELNHLKDKHFRWRPSIHMPKALARIFLRVRSVKVERLDDMVLADVLMEGITEGIGYGDTWGKWNETWNATIPSADRFRYGTTANPWVWVIKFEPCEKPEGFNG